MNHRLADAARFSVLVATLLLVVAAARVRGDEPSPQKVFSSALAVWHMADRSDAAGNDSRLELRGAAKLGVDLSVEERAASLARGGDGKAADLQEGGWLDAGQGADGELQFRGDAITLLLRLKCPSGVWETQGLFTKGGGHDKLVVNFFSHDFGAGPEIGFELGVEGKPFLGGQVRASLDRIGPKEWHDVAARYDGRELSLFVDGVLLDQKPAAGNLRAGNTEPVALGAGTSQGMAHPVFAGLIDHAAIWMRPLSREEIVAVSGGASAAAEREAVFAAWKPSPASGQIDELINRSRELVARLQADPQRPIWHFLAPEEGDCMPFDPNGAIFWKGRYHLFYIFQRRQAEEPQVVHCWGHASSVDLVHWTHHPTALDVKTGDVDRGIFSGNAFLDEQGAPTIMYHGVGVGNCIARSTDDMLLTWTKSPQNPITPIPQPGKPGHGVYESWDPHGWYENGAYYAIYGGARGALMKGKTLHSLAYQHPILEHDPWSEPGEDLSCPDFFRFGDKQMLLCISHRRGARYYLGRWENDRFVPESHARMNWPGGACFAPETMLDGQGRRLLWAWAFDPRGDSVRRRAGWSGVMSMPRVLSPAEGGAVAIEPAPELEQLRLNAVELSPISLEADTETALDGVAGDSLELEIEFDWTPSAGAAGEKAFGLKVRQSPDGAEQTEIAYLPDEGQLRIDFSRASLDKSVRYKSWFFHTPNDPAETHLRVTSQKAPLQLADGQRLKLRVFLDKSMLEVFANSRQCLTQRIFPTRADSRGVSVFTRGGTAKIVSFKAWEMAAANPH